MSLVVSFCMMCMYTAFLSMSVDLDALLARPLPTLLDTKPGLYAVCSSFICRRFCKLYINYIPCGTFTDSKQVYWPAPEAASYINSVAYILCLNYCLSVYICQTITFECRKFVFAHPVYLDWIRVKFVHEGHRVKVTGTKMVENPYSRNVELRSEITNWFNVSCLWDCKKVLWRSRLCSCWETHYSVVRTCFDPSDIVSVLL